MLDVDAMLEQLLVDDRQHHALPAGGECEVFARYLTGHPPAAYVAGRYAAALQRQARALASRGRFDGWLLRLGARHPWLTRLADLYARFFCADAALRSRLVMLLAIMETHGESVALIDRPDGSAVRFVFGLLLRSVTAALLLPVAILTLLPVQLLLGGCRGGTRE